VPLSYGRSNSLVNSPTELRYLLLTLIFTVSTRIHTISALFPNSSCSESFKYWSAHIKEVFMLYLLQNWELREVKFLATYSRCHCFPTCIIHANEFISLCFWIELRHFVSRQKYYSLKCLYELCSLAYSLSREYVFLVLVALGSL